MKTYREFINEIATQSTVTPKYNLGTPQTQTQSSKPVTRPSLMQQAQDLRAMRLRAIERQGGREDEAQRLRSQLSSAEQKVSDIRAAELAKLRQGARDQTIARSQNPVRNRTNTSNTTNTLNTANNNNTGRNDTRIAQANTVGGANVRRGYLPKPTGSIQGYTGIDRDKLNRAMDAETKRLNDLNQRRTDMETRNQQNPPPPKTQTQTQTPKTETQTQPPQTQTDNKSGGGIQLPDLGKWWNDTFNKPKTEPQQPTQPTQPTQPDTNTEPKTETPSFDFQKWLDDILNMSGNSNRRQPQSIAQSMDSAWRMRNRGTVAKRLEDKYNMLSDEDKKRFEEYSKSKGYNWRFINRG